MDLHYDFVLNAVTTNIVYLIEDIVIADLKKSERGKFYFSDRPGNLKLK